MTLVQSLLAVLTLLACTLASVSNPILPALLRGLVANLVLLWVLFALTGRIQRLWARAFALVLLALALSSMQAHVLINGSWPQLAHADLAADGDFLVALFSDRVFLVLLPLNLAWMLFTGLSERLRRLPSPRPALTAAVGTVLVGYLALTAVFTPGIGVHWYSRGALGHQLVGLARAFSEDVTLADGRLLVPAINGERLQRIAPPGHVLLVLIEGLSAHHVESGQVPALAALEPKGWRVPRFVAHQRQTHRGLFSALCGAYPNLVRREAKSDLMAMAGLRPSCLPAILSSAGMRTAFLQSADLGFMAKDLFADAAGFQVVKGQRELGPGPDDGPWGLDDRTLFERGLEALRSHRDQQNFIVLLTSGTHPPFHTPTGDNDPERAFAVAGDAVAWLVQQLESTGLLDETLVLISSDESSWHGEHVAEGIPASNRGFMLALGAGLRPGELSGLFGLVDIPVTVLDALGLSRHGFGGASLLREQPPGRMLLAANGYKGEVYLIRGQELTRCDTALHCVDVDGSRSTVEGLAKLLSRNELSRVTNSGVLAQMGMRHYEGNRANTLLGRYVTQQPRGTGLVLDLAADNTGGSEQLFQMGIYDCTGHEAVRQVHRITMPSNVEQFRGQFVVPQLFGEQCHQLTSKPTAAVETSKWTLQGLRLERDLGLDAAVDKVRAARSGIPSRRLYRIAHAGGASDDGRAYSNSFAAMDSSWRRGLRWFELDFQWTADGQLVCGHDWGPSIRSNLGIELAEVPTLAKFQRLVAGRLAAPCTVPALVRWIEDHPEARIITDLKERPMEGLARLAELVPNHRERLIAQVYQPEQHAEARSLGYSDVIWTLYRYAGGTHDVLAHLAEVDPIAVTMDKQRLLSGLGLVLKRAGVPVYAHTVNDPERARHWSNHWGVTEIYTDVLDPHDAH